MLTTDRDAVYDYIQQAVTAVRAWKRRTVMIYVNEIYFPFTSAWQTYSSLETLIFISMQKRTLLEDENEMCESCRFSS